MVSTTLAPPLPVPSAQKHRDPFVRLWYVPPPVFLFPFSSITSSLPTQDAKLTSGEVDRRVPCSRQTFFFPYTCPSVVVLKVLPPPGVSGGTKFSGERHPPYLVSCPTPFLLPFPCVWENCPVFPNLPFDLLLVPLGRSLDTPPFPPHLANFCPFLFDPFPLPVSFCKLTPQDLPF